jgi:hypothetical protein
MGIDAPIQDTSEASTSPVEMANVATEPNATVYVDAAMQTEEEMPQQPQAQLLTPEMVR